ncbi:MAG: ribosome maturation factor RimP [Alphaproteobacteria bacterium]|nr:ribosome maturation factor RimP [Alphaproteobacteria bacterium]
MKSVAEKVEAVIAPSLADMGFNLVQVKLMDGRGGQTLQIMAERPDGSMSLDDCATISRQISALLDVEDVIATAYRLEVSSPGIDRPLVKPADYPPYIGHAAKIETMLPVNGRKRFTGTIAAVTEKDVLLAVDGKEHALPFIDIQSAKLVLTDALIKAHQARAEAS